jgi:GT2 family glycosyltransferase
MQPSDPIIFSSSQGMPTAKTDALATVIVSCCGQLEYTRLCVPSLLRFTRQPYELLFLDSDSRDGTAEYLEGLAAAAPAPMEVARVPADPPVGSNAKKDDVIPIRGEFVALLNNDVIVTSGWLDRLIAIAVSSPTIGMVAPMSNHAPPAQRVENIGYSIDDLESAADARPAESGPARLPRASLLPLIERVNRFAAEWRDKHTGDRPQAETLGGGCVLVKREVLRKLGLFPTRTPLGTFDTAALSQRVLQAGFQLGVCGDLFVHSFGSRG